MNGSVMTLLALLKGAGMGERWPNAAALAAIGALLLQGAWLIFRRQW